jgi:hypothetical protein
MNRISISKLERPQYAGDWHDKPLRWSVKGPGSEEQHFSTRPDARLYARIRRGAETFREALSRFINESV